MILTDVIRVLENIAPSDYAMPGDRIGLQVGDPAQNVNRIMVTVDVTPDVVTSAITQSVELLIAHHPLIYNPLPSLRMDVYPQSLVYLLAKSEVSLFIMHTNYDSASGGINDSLAECLGLQETSILEAVEAEKLYKLVTFIPSEAIDTIRDALSEAGAGVIGNYTHCTFQSPGTGTFMPMQGASPYIGEVGELETAQEYRLEVRVPQRNLHSVISALMDTHPYEEVAYDIYPLWNKGEERGIGRVGTLRSPMSFEGFCEMVRDVLEVEETRVAGNPDARVETVAVIGGSGGSRIELAKSAGVDAFVTGDVNHHQMEHARALNLNIIDATHFYTERPGMLALAPRLHDFLSMEGISVEYADDITLGKR